MKKKIPKIIIGCLVLILILSTMVFGEDNEKVIAYINEEPICLDEFMFYFDNNKVKIYNEINSNGEYDDVEDFWSEKIDGQTALEKAKQLTLDEVSKIKLIQILAKENNLIDEIDYKSFEKALKDENKRRKKAKENNEVIYGPIEYTEKQYYQYLIENLIIGLKRKIELKEVDLSDGNVNNYYNENLDDYKLDDKVLVDVISINFLNDDEKVLDENKEQAYNNLEKIRERLLLNEDIDKLEFEANKINIYELSFDYENKRLNDKYNAEFIEEIKEMKVGDISKIIEQNGSYNLLICKERAKEENINMEEVKEEIRAKLVDDYYNLMIDEAMKSSDIRVNEESLRKIK